ncbi:hypothetical protein HF072_06860 [Bacillus sp. RO3]|nr:hypothetical protein [Bacillus sp. RO3]
MTKVKLEGLMMISALISLAGGIMVFFSVNFGVSLGEYWLSKRGGANHDLYLNVIEGYTNSFLAGGSVLLAVGLLAGYFHYYKLLHLKE